MASGGPGMGIPACVVGRLGADGPWVGFAPTVDDGYVLTVGAHREPATAADLVALAVAWFEEALGEPSDELAATLGDIAAIVRHAAERITEPALRRRYDEAVDAIDDGLAADVVLERLARALGDGVDALEHLRARARAIGGTAAADA